ncbi:MAG: hypothetical protein EPN26_12890 [Rhodospirillales bacterium]|nr:MAG: hypothetical protein EPN26_12890 [Rhodospirillales bacterium]
MGESLSFREEARLEAALELIEKLGQPGVAVVPRLPSNNMLAAAVLAGDISPERARRVWSAMLAVVET